MASIVPSERVRAQLDAALQGAGEEHDPIEAVGRLGARLILQQALEDEVTEFLGRARYERTGEPGVHRNGYEPTTVKTTAGPVGLERPRLRNQGALSFASALVGKGVARTHALEALVIASFLRGLSVRDVEAALEEAFDEPVVSKSTVSRICQDTRERYRAWCRRRLDEHDVVYCFLDALYLKLRPSDEPAEGVLVCWGVTLEGRKVLLGLALGSRESYDSWLAFGRDLIERGMRAPALVIADGAPGIWKAVAELWPAARAQRCTVHALRNVTAKLPERHHAELKARWWRAFDEAASPAEASAGLRAIVSDYRSAYPSAMAVIERDLDTLVEHLRFPSDHRKRIRSTNLLERTFVEVRRRTKVIGRFPGETSALCLIWAVLELASRGWRGVVMTPKSAAEIERLRRNLAVNGEAANADQAEEVIAA
ncbi:MAG: IS256 family transposase [Actinobacteria bacterium]|nr:IS256 family transposase [Actinomycetota bacterium]MCA1698483.1 IS256 family transposase [Actinomycetota bacterium]